ncbi:hypothetical protein MKX03_000853 [Papaver bracteatum]|nr:hypothetical protein MKX03_000853 [Papaver bracteatum]
MSLRDTSMGEQSEILKRIDFMIEMYIPRLDIMLGWLRSKIQQLPVSSENFTSRPKPEQIECLHNYVKFLEKERSSLQISQFHCQYSMDEVIRWEKRLVEEMNMPNLMAAFQSPGDQRSLLQIPQLRAGTPLQSALPSSALSSCTPLASSDLPASVDTMSSRDTSIGEQIEIKNKFNIIKEVYIPLLDEMLGRWGCRIQQLPISSENLPSHVRYNHVWLCSFFFFSSGIVFRCMMIDSILQLKPDEIGYIKKYKTDLEFARNSLQMSVGARGSMDAVIRWEKKIVGYLNLPNVMAAVQLPGDLLLQLQIPRMKQHDSNQNNSEKSVSTMTPIERLVDLSFQLCLSELNIFTFLRAVNFSNVVYLRLERSSPKALSAAVDDIRSVVSMTDVFAGSHPSEGGARSFFHENLAFERRNFKVIKNVDEKKLKLCYSVESSSRLEVNHVLLEEVGEINHVLINTKLSISDKSITLASGAGEDVEGMIVNCTFSPISRSSSTEKFLALPMWFLIPANYPLCTPVLLDCLHDSRSHSYEYEYLLTDAKNKFHQSLRWIPDLTLKGMAESWDSCADAAFSEHARRMAKY